MNTPSFIVKSALRNPRRTILTITSIAVSLAMIVVLQSVLKLFFDPTAERKETIPRIVARHRVSLTLDLPITYEAKIRTVDGVQDLTTMSWFGGIYKDEKLENQFPRFGVDLDDFFKVFTEFTPDENFQQALAERSAAVVGDQLMKRYGWKVGDRITLKGDIYPVDLELTIRSVFSGNDPAANADILVFDKKYLDESLGETQRAGSYFIMVRSPKEVERVCQEIEALFRNSDAEVRAETEKAFQLSFVEMLGNIKLLFSSLISVVVFSILLIASSTMAMAIRERTREIAVLKTLGFSRETVTLMVVAEGMLVSLAGGILGVGGAWLVLPRPPLFLALAAFLAVLAAIGLPTLLLAILLPEDETGRTGPNSVRSILLKYGPWVATVLASLIAGMVFYLNLNTDWFKFSGGILPFLNVRTETVVFGSLVALGIGIASSAIPAWNAARLRVLDGLRTIG
ncbi:MAG: FtsX-like permease family protein [Candidatus Sumerlaeia bacterium]|nr:FtsX-like permease family protein [Candidatus Sumerlaeia bacterium]